MQTQRTFPRSTASEHVRPTRLLHPRDWPVRHKLIAVVAIPVVAFAALAGVSIAASLRSAQALRGGAVVATFEHRAAALVHELQLERDLTAGMLAGVADDDALRAQQDRVNRAARTYRAGRGAARDAASPALRGLLDTAASELDGLDGLRTATGSGSLHQRAVVAEYTQIITALSGIDLQAALRSGDEQLAQRVRAFAALERAKELAAQVRGRLYAIAIRDAYEVGEFQDLADLLAQRDAARDQFAATATEQQRGLRASIVQGQAVLAVARIEQAAIRRQARPTLDLDPQQWLAAATTELEAERAVETRLLDAVIQRSRDLSAAAGRRALSSSALILLVVAIALAASLGIARSMARPLRQLRQVALEVADQRLPRVVERLQATRHPDLDLDLDRYAREHASPLPVTSTDEIGQVAAAFNAVHQVAVRVATEQGALRMSIGDMFLNLARRSQRLNEQLIGQLDDLQRDQIDPDLLQQLFGVDLLATRMRRNAEDLIVLSGAESPRRWRQPVPLDTVVRAAYQEAIQEVADLQRVELLHIDNLNLLGYAVNDVVHLLAELIENAVAYSPPGTVVRIGGQPTASGYVLEIEDRGLGMSDEELQAANDKLANPPMIDQAVSRQLGLFVVSRLAQRYEIRIQLRHSWYGGVTALAMLPSALLVPAVDEPMLVRPAGGELPQRTPPLPTETIGGRPAGEAMPNFEPDRSDWFDPLARPGIPGPAGAIWPPPAPPGPAGIGPDRRPPLVAERPGGLPRRIPMTNLAAGIPDQPSVPLTPTTQANRDPDEIRSMLASYRAGLERGRRMAAGADPRTPPLREPRPATDEHGSPGSS